jgi:cardiolipin synthase A/B
VLEFNPINPLAAKTPWLINNRDHRKLLVVDGRTAFIGGINISSVYSSGSIARRTVKAAENTAAWRDTDLQIEGPVVGELQKLFMQTWEKQRGKPRAPKEYFPALKAQGKDIVRAIGSTPGDPYSLIYLTLISAIGNAEMQVHLTHAYFVPVQGMDGAGVGAVALAGRRRYTVRRPVICAQQRRAGTRRVRSLRR